MGLGRGVSGTRRRSRLGYVIALCVPAFAVLVAVLSDAAMHTVARSADNATVLLEGHSIATGNLLLHGWTLSLDSFWTVDALIYGVGVALVGLQEYLMFVVPAAIVALIVVLSISLAVASRTRRGVIAAGATVIALLALPSPVLSYFLLQGPWHVGTVLWCLIAFAGLSKGRFGRSWLISIVFLSMALLGDLTALAIGIAPVVASGAVISLEQRRWRAGAPALLGGLAAIVLAIAVRSVATLFGTYSLAYRNVPLHASNILANLRDLPIRLGALFGVTGLPITHVAPEATLERVVHLSGALAVAVSVAFVLGRVAMACVSPKASQTSGTNGRRLEVVLVLGVVSDLALFVLAAPNNRLNDTSFLSATVVFGAVLAGRSIGQLSENLRSSRVALGFSLATIAVFGLYATQFGLELAGTAPTTSSSALGEFLEAHGLVRGLGDYPTAPLVSVITHGRTVVRPVVTEPGGRLDADDRQSSNAWYVGRTFQFFVYDAAHPWRDVNEATATRTFGVPAHIYRVGVYRVLTWGREVAVQLAPVKARSPLHFAISGVPRPGGVRSASDL